MSTTAQADMGGAPAGADEENTPSESDFSEPGEENFSDLDSPESDEEETVSESTSSGSGTPTEFEGWANRELLRDSDDPPPSPEEGDGMTIAMKRRCGLLDDPYGD